MRNFLPFALDLLKAHGWADGLRVGGPVESTIETLRSVLLAYQQFHCLEPTGELDNATYRSLQEPRFCGHPDVMPVGETLRKWPTSALTWAVLNTVPGLGVAEFKEAASLAWGYWMEAAPALELAYTANVKTASIVMDTGRIDGPGNTLAWSQLPGRGVRQVEQKYDTGEKWGAFEGLRRGQTDLVRVLCHEGGHALGLDHGPAGCLMQPTVSEVRRPRGWDVEEILRRYPGIKPVPAPEPPRTIPDPAPGEPLRISIYGDVSRVEIPGFRVTRLGA